MANVASGDVPSGAPSSFSRTQPVSTNKSGLVVGLFLSGWHLLWSALVALGLAQPLMDFIFWLHFIRPVYVIEPFDPRRAVVLVGLTAVLGYAIGWVLGSLWNIARR